MSDQTITEMADRVITLDKELGQLDIGDQRGIASRRIETRRLLKAMFYAMPSINPLEFTHRGLRFFAELDAEEVTMTWDYRAVPTAEQVDAIIRERAKVGGPS